MTLVSRLLARVCRTVGEPDFSVTMCIVIVWADLFGSFPTVVMPTDMGVLGLLVEDRARW